MTTEIEELIAGSEPARLAAPDVDALRACGRRRRVARRAAQASGTLAVVAAVAVGLAGLQPPAVSVDPLGQGTGGPPPRASSDPSPEGWQVLPTLDGWSAVVMDVRVVGGPVDSGEYKFQIQNVAANMEISWTTGDSRGELVPTDPAAVVEDITIVGNPGVVIVQAETDPLRAVWFDGARTFQARGYEVDRVRFEDFLASLEVVDDATWQQAQAAMLEERARELEDRARQEAERAHREAERARQEAEGRG